MNGRHREGECSLSRGAKATRWTAAGVLDREEGCALIHCSYLMKRLFLPRRRADLDTQAVLYECPAKSPKTLSDEGIGRDLRIGVGDVEARSERLSLCVTNGPSDRIHSSALK